MANWDINHLISWSRDIIKRFIVHFKHSCIILYEYAQPFEHIFLVNFLLFNTLSVITTSDLINLYNSLFCNPELNFWYMI